MVEMRFEGTLIELGIGARGMRIEPFDSSERASVIARIPLTVDEAKQFGPCLDGPVTISVRSGISDALSEVRLAAVARAARKHCETSTAETMRALSEAVKELRPGDLP